MTTNRMEKTNVALLNKTVGKTIKHVTELDSQTFILWFSDGSKLAINTSEWFNIEYKDKDKDGK